VVTRVLLLVYLDGGEWRFLPFGDDGRGGEGDEGEEFGKGGAHGCVEGDVLGEG
jgi:hypothetical protein